MQTNPENTLGVFGPPGTERMVAGLLDARAQGADVLVGEVFEVEPTLALIRMQSPNLTEQQAFFLEKHLRAHHLTAADLGALAAKAGVGKLVVTHIGSNHRGFDPAAMKAEIAESFDGEITIGKDMDSF